MTRDTRLALLLAALLLRAAGAATLTPDHLERILGLERFRLPQAFPEEVVREGPLLHIFPGPGGLLLVETQAILALGPEGEVRWRVGFPYGLRRVVSSRGGDWLAGTTTRIHADLQRETADWLLDARTGDLRVLARDRHPMGDRRTDRVLLPWSPLPFDPMEGESASEDTTSVAVPLPEAAPTMDLTPPKLGYRGRRTGDVFLEEGLFVLRSTFFTRSEKAWWSLHHYDPHTGAALKLADGNRLLEAGALASFRPHPRRQDHFYLEVDGQGLELDPLSGTMVPTDERPPPPPRPGLTLLEGYHLEPGGSGGGVVLVHPEGRLRLTLGGQTLEDLVEIPGTGVVYALSADRKRSIIGDDRRRTLFRLDLTRADENLAAHEDTRAFQEQLNQALALVDRLAEDPLDAARDAFHRIEELLSRGRPGTVQGRQAQEVLVRARGLLAPRLAKGDRVPEALALLRGCENAALAELLLRLDLTPRRPSLEEDLERVLDRLDELGPGGSLETTVVEALATVGRLEEALQRIERLARAESRSQSLAALAVRVGDLATRDQHHDRAAAAYRLALRLKPSSQGAAMKLVRALERDGHPCAALPVLARLIATDDEAEPTGVRARLLRLALDCKDLERARRVLDGLRLDRPLEPLYLEWEAELLVMEGHPEQARPRLEALLRLRPRDTSLQRKLEGLGAGTGR